VFEDDGVHLNKAGYDVLLAALAGHVAPQRAEPRR
jgi:lysophospholipase L1-like esterase